MRFHSVCVALPAVIGSSSVAAWAPTSGTSGFPPVPRAACLQRNLVRDTYQWSPRNLKLHMVDTSEQATSFESGLSDDEFSFVAGLCEKASSGDQTLDQVVLEALPTINPALVMKLRGAVQDSREEFQAVSTSLNSILDSRLTEARNVLEELLNAGEIRKLDSLIGKNAREGKLDVAFFQVLNMNLQDAASNQPVPTNEDGEENTANRFQILQHIYTRCQEEVEKTIPPGVALLNKLMRTEVANIRTNQLNHYLCPQSNVIKTPDGKELELKGREKILVPHNEFVEAIANSIKQIRTVEKAGGASQEMAANMVEAVRQVAKEARVVVGEHFGVDSDELKSFEDGLMPVFRPSSPDSEYIKGV